MRPIRSLFALFTLFAGMLLAAAGCTGGISVRYPTFPNDTCPSCDRQPA